MSIKVLTFLSRPLVSLEERLHAIVLVAIVTKDVGACDLNLQLHWCVQCL